MNLLKLKVLVVDDDPYYTEPLGDFLKDKSHAVFLARNGREALEIIKKQQEALLPLDLVLIDYVFPDDDGIDISHKIRELAPEMFRVALTEHNAPTVYKKLVQEGDFLEVISKFDSDSTLLRMLEEVYNRKRERCRKDP